MRLEKIQFYFNENKKIFQYTECDNLGSIDLEHRGVPYHIWEFYVSVTPSAPYIQRKTGH